MSEKLVGSLFAGIGGIDLGFKKAGFKTQWANEIDKKACETYFVNFPNKIICDGIESIDCENLEKIDVLTAGFPCQPFSIAGKRRGLDDPRGGNLFLEIIRIIKKLEPRVVFLENVKNLKFHNGGKTLNYMIDLLKSAGYKVEFKIMNSCQYSVIPQNRERLYIVCFKSCEDYERFRFPEIEKKQDSIKRFLENPIPIKFYSSLEKSKIYPQLLAGRMKI